MVRAVMARKEKGLNVVAGERDVPERGSRRQEII